jgi:hypothetical protein
MAKQIEMTEAEFDKKFTVKPNHIVPENEHGYETYGPENAYITDPKNANFVWTVLDGDGGMCLVSGYHHVNRMHHLVTNESHEGKDITVEWGE